MRMVWHDLLFAHWRVDPAEVRRCVPAPLELDLLHGEAWLAVVPFRMSGVGLRCLATLPFASAFPELNVRTYVRHGGKPGVWFFSLDAASRIAVRIARAWFHLPYFDARMAVRSDGDAIRYHSVRTHSRAPHAALALRYAPVGEPFSAPTDPLASWLTERYCLYATDRRGQVLRGEIHHRPWSLQTARAEFEEDSMTEALGIRREGPALLHFARELSVVAWNPERA